MKITVYSTTKAQFVKFKCRLLWIAALDRPSNWAARNKIPPGDFWHARTTRPGSRTFCRTIHKSTRAASPVAGDAVAGQYSWAWPYCAGAGLGSRCPAAAVGVPVRGCSGDCSAPNGPQSSAAYCSPRSRPFSCYFLPRHHHFLD